MFGKKSDISYVDAGTIGTVNESGVQFGNSKGFVSLARLREAYEGWLPNYMSKVD